MGEKGREKERRKSRWQRLALLSLRMSEAGKESERGSGRGEEEREREREV